MAAGRKWRVLAAVGFLAVLLAFSARNEESLYRSALPINPAKGTLLLSKWSIITASTMTN